MSYVSILENQMRKCEDIFDKYYFETIKCSTDDDILFRDAVLNTELYFDSQRDYENFEQFVYSFRNYDKKCNSDITDEYVRNFIETF